MEAMSVFGPVLISGLFYFGMLAGFILNSFRWFKAAAFPAFFILAMLGIFDQAGSIGVLIPTIPEKIYAFLIGVGAGSLLQFFLARVPIPIIQDLASMFES